MIETFTYETFAQRCGEVFQIDPTADGAATVEVQLVEVTAAGGARPDGTLPFSLVFSGPASPILTQRIYRVTHAALAVFELFLVPLTPDAAGARYEAVFN